MDTSKDTVITLKNAPLLVRMEPSLRQQLAKQAKAEGVSAAALARMAIRAFMEPAKHSKRR